MMGITLLIFLSFLPMLFLTFLPYKQVYSLENEDSKVESSRETLNPYNETPRLFHFFVHFVRDLIMN